MFKVKNNLINLGLMVLIALAFALFIAPAALSAQETGYNYTFRSGNPVNNYPYQYPTPQMYGYQTPQSYGYQTPQMYAYPTPVVRTVYTYPTPAVRTVYTYPTPAVREAGTYYPTPATGTITMTSTVNRVPGSNTDNKETQGEKAKELASNVVFGKSGFMPSGLMQWVLIAILILFIVILARKIFGGTKSYYSTPLKHA